jgi:ribosome-binding protein aMBF1 (putative translation factor)
MAKRRQPKAFSEQLREIIQAAIEDGYGSAYELAQAAGVDRSVLSRFAAGKRTMNLDTVDRLAELLKLRIDRPGR